MSEKMHPLPFGRLAKWVLAESEKRGAAFGIREGKFQKDKALIGPAAGPHTQMAQNILSAWLCGGSFIELKTVQEMDGDRLSACVPRPCIKASDEGYNVEWSTELLVEDALAEYAKAWVLIHAFSKEFFGEEAKPVFNMSVGYDLAGIKSPKIDGFIEGLKDAKNVPAFKDSIEWLELNIGLFKNLTSSYIAQIPSRISRSVTLSTLHGCPPEEIERIASYLLCEKGLDTFVKLNPTLIGFDEARRLLDQQGFSDVRFDRHHFDNDLKLDDAIPMLARLKSKADSLGLAFGVKLTNTFPVETQGTLPGDEMYMSGKALLPLSLKVASIIAREFSGTIPISYSGGADFHSIKDISAAGASPITLATALLKPGGYEKLSQLSAMVAEAESLSADAFDSILAKLPHVPELRKSSLPSRKGSDPLPLFDCFTAPCSAYGCPLGQRVPEYLRLASLGRYREAFDVIAIDNTSPACTSLLCPKFCEGKCARLDIDSSLNIREAKRTVCVAAQAESIGSIVPAPLKTQKKALVIGAGPAGLATAIFLRRAGMQADVFESRDKPGGAVSHLIPQFRLPQSAWELDFRLAQASGVEVSFGKDGSDPETVKQYDYVVAAVGAWKESSQISPGDESIDALDYLSRFNKGETLPGVRVAVIGGGDVAMDCARQALRVPGVEKVSIVYRRTRNEMPANPDELKEALHEGAELLELLAPVSYKDSILEVSHMALGERQNDGRRSVSPTGATESLSYDLCVRAIGARVLPDVFDALSIPKDRAGRPVSDANGETPSGAYVVGDCKGPATIAQAIGDAKKAAISICLREGLEPPFPPQGKLDLPECKLLARRGLVNPEVESDCDRCLGCSEICEICCDVCPNRANTAIKAPGFENCFQILHIDAFCNECGNCEVFCPRQGKPYEKLTLFEDLEGFSNSKNTGFLVIGNGRVLLRENSAETETAIEDIKDPRFKAVIEAVISGYSYLLPEKA
ncbi:MAG: putative selenate reductase subunit YgfK [Clostridiales bacterium]|jgi:putative selenate reductase|nr:putative selenate reductase subunit YgfK [Clostridiales bacterium]